LLLLWWLLQLLLSTAITRCGSLQRSLQANWLLLLLLLLLLLSTAINPDASLQCSLQAS
jgi:hypothetical protein